VPPPLVKVMRSQLTIRFMARQHVKDTDHHGPPGATGEKFTVSLPG
jgi:hypothetical protein